MNPAEDGVHAGRADGGWETDYEQLAGLNHLLGLQREEGDREAALGTARRALERARRLPPLHRLAVAEALQELREELTASELWDEARQVAVETVRAYAGSARTAWTCVSGTPWPWTAWPGSTCGWASPRARWRPS